MIIFQIQLTADHGHLNAGKRQVLCTLVRTATIIKIMFLIFVIKVILKYLDQVRASGSYRYFEPFRHVHTHEIDVAVTCC